MSDFPPTKTRLEALAGWALVEQAGADGSRAAALGKFRDGCESLAPFATDIESPARAEVTIAPSTTSAQPVIPKDIANCIERKTCQTGGSHHFDITTQHCIGCGRSYRDVKGRAPELM